MKNKLYGEYTNGGLGIWVRYTRGGTYCPINLDDFRSGQHPGPAWEIGYQQATGYIGYTQDVKQDINGRLFVQL